MTEKVKSQCSKNFLKQLEEQLQDVYISCNLCSQGFDLFLKEMAQGNSWIKLSSEFPEFHKITETDIVNCKIGKTLTTPNADLVERDSKLP